MLIGSFLVNLNDFPHLKTWQIFGTITAGFPELREQESKNRIVINEGSVSIKPSARTFALQVNGDSMPGRHIQNGDTVVLEHGLAPVDGDVVAVLIDNSNVLRTWPFRTGKCS